MKFYVYELVVQPEGRVCYVGKGKENRCHEHLKCATNPKSPLYNRLMYQEIRRLLDAGNQISPRIVFRTDDEMGAFQEEKRRIEHYGFGNLLNVASHAFLGRTLKPSARKRISESISALWRSGVYATNPTCRGYRLDYAPKLKNRRPRPARHPGLKGVSLWRDKKRNIERWCARIVVNGATVTLGYRESATCAAALYDDYFEHLHGSRPNGSPPTGQPVSLAKLARSKDQSERGRRYRLFRPIQVAARRVASEF